MSGQETPGPYRGLRVYRTEDSHRFFGRDEEAHELRKLWRSQRLTVLYGASGIGKTSLLQAGVMPLLSPSKADVLPLGRVSYGSAFPRAAIPAHNPYVLALLMSWSPQAPPNRLATMTIPRFLRDRPVRRDSYGDRLPRLVAIDQVEELFADGRGVRLHRDWFFGQLAEALQADPGLRLLLSIRIDKLMDLVPYEWDMAPGLGREAPASEGEPAETQLQRLPLEALSRDHALEAVRGPLQGAGCVFAEGAAEEVVRDLIKVRARTENRQLVREVDPVQLQVVCESLWASLPPESTEITKGHVHQFADQALAEHYEREIREIAAERFHGDERRLSAWLQRTFADRRLVRDSAVTSSGIGRTVVALLVKRRILRADQWMGEGSYALAYDRLLQPVKPGGRRADASPRMSPPEELLREAEGALGEGDLLQAAGLADEALALAKEDDLRLRAQIQSLLGNIAYEHEDLEEAIEHYSTAAKHYETTGSAAAVGLLLTAIGRLRLAQGSPAEAVRELRAAMLRVPADFTIQTELAWALWHGGHPDAAVGVLDGVLDKEGNNLGALLGRGQMLAGMGHAEAALHDLDRAKPLRWPFARMAYALALAQTGRTELAQQELAEAMAEDDKGHDPQDRPHRRHGPLLLYAARVEQLSDDSTSARDLAKRAISAREPALPDQLADLAHQLAGQ